MAKTKVTQDDAQEWLASLQQVGEGWYRQVGLAVRMGAHDALGITRKEFAGQIGQKLVDPRQAIIELHQEGMARAAIADVLGVDKDRTVDRVLAEEGLIEPTRKVLEKGTRQHREGGAGVGSSGEQGGAGVIDSTADEVDEEKEQLAAQLAEAEGEAKEAKKQLAKLRKAETERLRDEAAAAAAAKTDEDRRREHKEAEASVDEVMSPVNAFAASMDARTVVGLLEEAAEIVGRIIDKGVTAEIVDQITAARDAFNSELIVAEAMVSSGGESAHG